MAESKSVKVWDLFVRVFHWTLVAGFFIAYVTEEEAMGLHIWAGYLVFSLVVLRILWGFVGSEYARFSSFVRGPTTVIGYLSQLRSGTEPRHIGHNPAGGAMILALLICVLLTAVTGMLIFGAENPGSALGSLASSLGIVGEAGAEALEEPHEVLANLTLALVAVHVGGVIYESLRHGENLVRAMVTGRKQA
jgi:cytochrome b